MQPLQCRTCGNEVLVEKFSWHHTSVQWQADSATACAEFRADAESGTRTVHTRSCSALRASIRQAALDGRIDVPDF